MAGLQEGATADKTSSPLEAFSGTIGRTKTGPLYSIGLGVVAFAMVLLPMIYIALILLAVWAVVLHLRYDTWLFEGRSASIARLILYLGPVAAGGILIFFMIKPFFAAKVKPPQPITLDPAHEPLLFEFVRKICGLVRSPVPCRIDVDCQVNASASLRRGLWSKDLVLTIGLPLASGLNMREFAGVLAHEFGHFAQGAGMRLTYIIRKINFWFARVVYERDEWDIKLDRTARGSDWRVAIVLHTARGCVWLSRRILWGLMQAGHGISCFMMRQMEYDADSYEAKVAGSDTFQITMSRIGQLHVAMNTAYEDVRQSWASNRLPENLPLLINHKAGSLPAEIQEKLSTSVAAKKTGWFDTHPCDADRARAAQGLKEPGVFRLAEPATALFSDFNGLSKKVTRHQYEKHLELEFSDQNLISADEIIRESAANAEAAALVRKYYGNVNPRFRPLLTVGEFPASANDENALLKWREARGATDTLRAEAEKASAECAEQQNRFAGLTCARALALANFKLEPKQFGLPQNATSPSEQEVAARLALEEATKAKSDDLKRLDPFMTVLRQRVTLALVLAQTDANRSGFESPDALPKLARLLAAVAAEMPVLYEIDSKFRAFCALGENRGNHPSPGKVSNVMADIVADLRSSIDGIQKRLNDFVYPFPHARGQLTVAEYARFEKPPDNDWQRVYQDSNAHVERLFALHDRLIGRILAHAEAAEKSPLAVAPNPLAPHTSH